MTELQRAEFNVITRELALDKAEMAWLNSRGDKPVQRERLWQVYMLAANKLADALIERDKLRVKLGVHPFMRLVQA